MCLVSSTPKIDIYQAILQMPRREQNCEFCHIEFRGKNSVIIFKNEIYLIFLYIFRFKIDVKDLTKWHPITFATFVSSC